MPLTPLHYPVAYALKKLEGRLSLPGLLVGSMFPDLEIVALMLWFRTRAYRDSYTLVFSSLLGAATIGTTLSVVLTVLIYPPLVSGLFKIERSKVERACRLSFPLIASCLLGNISHALLDVVNHPDNPLLWPFLRSITSPVCLAIGEANAALIANTLLLLLLAIIVINQDTNRWEKLLVED